MLRFNTLSEDKEYKRSSNKPCYRIHIRAQTNLNRLELLEFLAHLTHLMSHMHISVFHPSQALPSNAYVRSEFTLRTGHL